MIDRRRPTIAEVAMQVLADAGQGLMASEIYRRIVEQGLYQFQARDPLAVLSSTLRKHCDQSQLSGRRAAAYFVLSDGKFRLLKPPRPD